MLGSICAVDVKPHSLSDSQRRALMTIAGQCVAQLELKRQIRQLKNTLVELNDAKVELKVSKELAEANQALSERAKEQAEQAKIEAERCRVEAERANDHKTSFLANMSHEIRSVQSIIFYDIETIASIDHSTNAIQFSSSSFSSR